MVSFFVPGIPKPGGSKTAFPLRYKDGSPVMKNGRQVINMADDSKNRDWKASVSLTARDAMGENPLLVGPLALDVEFYMPRLKSHFRANGQLKPNAPRFHTTKPDATKLLRSMEDALTGVIWRDDAAIALQKVSKRYEAGQGCGAKIIVLTIEAEAVI